MTEKEYMNFYSPLAKIHNNYQRVYGQPYDYYIPLTEPHYNVKNRTADDIHGVVIHTTEGWRPPLHTFNKAGRNASTHYSVERDGTVILMVHEKDRAWHAGSGVNDWSVGIETTGFSVHDGESAVVGDPIGFGMTQMNSLARLVADIAKRNKFRPSRRTVFAHQHTGGCNSRYHSPESSQKATPYNPILKGTGGGSSCHHDVGNDFPWDKFMRMVYWYYYKNTIFMLGGLSLFAGGFYLYKKDKLPKRLKFLGKVYQPIDNKFKKLK